MQSNPSYGMGKAAGSGMDRNREPYSDKGRHGYGDAYFDDTSAASALTKSPSYHRSTSASGRAEPSGHYFSQGATSESVFG